MHRRYSVGLLVVFLCLGEVFVVAKPKMEVDKRVHDGKVSDNEHFSAKTGEHNLEYDHDAFLGQDKKNFDSLSPQESKRRLGKIVDRIDKNKDARLSREELVEWMRYAGNRWKYDDGDRMWAHLKKREAELSKGGKLVNKDSPITWDLWKVDSFGPQMQISANKESQYRRDRQRWKTADRNKDDKISKEEFTAFIHPQEFDHMSELVLQETMGKIDKDKDGYVSVDELLGDRFPNNIRKGTKDEKDWVQAERKHFLQEKDTDKDGKLNRKEVRDYIFPAYDHLSAEVDHLISETDTDQDGLLTREEVMARFQTFVGSRATEFGNAFKRHEEF